MDRSAKTLLLCTETAGVPPPIVSADRFEDLGCVSVGGMGEIHRVHDRILDRRLLLKVLRPELASQGYQLERFLREARLTAGLQHPNIVAVHELGVLPDGRLFFTMREVHGKTLTELIAALTTHASRRQGWVPTPDGLTLRRVIDVIHQVCLTVAFAHDHGVIHGDLKPDNVVVGAYGEIAVLDWGLATRGEIERTEAWRISGTPAYMAPEQAKAAPRTNATDTYALGATLYEALSGAPPYPQASAKEVLKRLRRGEPPPPLQPIDGAAFVEARGYVGRLATDPPGPPIPAALAAAVRRAMAHDPADRHPSARALAQDLSAWLEGHQRAEDARTLVRSARAQIPTIEALRRRAADARARADAIDLPRHAPDEEKRAVWALLDEAEEADLEADQVEVDLEGTVRGALDLSPGLPEAHETLADRLRVGHLAAEGRGDRRTARQIETRLRAHTLALPERSPARRALMAYLVGEGTVSLQTDPAGVPVRVFAHERVDRRQVPRPKGVLGTTPFVAQRLAMGSYRLLIEGPAGPVCVPVFIDRGGSWDGLGPDGESVPIPLDVGQDRSVCYVPAGWAQLGDQDAGSRRVWVDGFVIDRDPVTNAQYAAFLNDLWAKSGEAALRHVPRERTGSEDGRPVFEQDADGKFRLGCDEDGDQFQPDWPVVLVDWDDARAYAAWRAARSGMPWRLPSEWEWEKAARGVDGRRFPWGDHPEDTWACTLHAHAGRPLLAPIGAYPIDESVYGIRQLAGNIHEWCADAYGAAPPPGEGERAVLSEPTEAEIRVVRGGAWNNAIRNARCDGRNGAPPASRMPFLGFRLARSV